MAFTRPSGRAALYYVTASDWNTDLVDNTAYIYDNTQGVVYTPTWTTAGTACALGNGTLQGRYFRIGHIVWFQIQFVAGSSTTFGTGKFQFLLPVTGLGVLGSSSAYFVDSGTQIYTGAAFMINTTQVSVTWTGDTSTGGVTATTPMTWANGDSINLSGFYFAATN